MIIQENEPTRHANGNIVVISIVGFRNADDVGECLAALEKLTDPGFVVSVCENGGAKAFDSLVGRLRGFVSPQEGPFVIHDPRVERAWSGVLRSGQPVHLMQAKENLGFAGGVNVTLRQFSDDPSWTAVWLLNPDTQPEPGALSALRRRAEETGALMVGGRLIFSESGRIQLYGGIWRRLIARGYNIGFNSPGDAPVDVAEIERLMSYISGASLYVSRRFINRFGPMPEEYFLYCEEVDWCLRADRQSIRYAHECIVMHHHGATIGSSTNQAKRSDLSVYLSERNKLLLSRRFYPKEYPVIVVIALVLILLSIMKGSANQLRIAFEGWLAGVRGETGLPGRFKKKLALRG